MGVFGDVAAIGKWLKNNPDYAISWDERASDPDYYGKGEGIAVRKGNDALLQEINAALYKVKASPEYAWRRNGLRSNSVAESCRMRRSGVAIRHVTPHS